MATNGFAAEVTFQMYKAMTKPLKIIEKVTRIETKLERY